jgi:hypothetical protein
VAKAAKQSLIVTVSKDRNLNNVARDLKLVRLVFLFHARLRTGSEHVSHPQNRWETVQ